MRFSLSTLACALLLAGPAAAEVLAAGPDGFTIRHSALHRLPPAQAWDALVDWGGWWPDGHTYSGKAANLELDVEPAGELEEEWDGGAVLHGLVLQAQTAKLLRLSAAFGPLQALPVQGVLDIALEPEGAGTRMILSYRVGGPAGSKLADFAAPVDAVMGEAFARLVVHAPPPPASKEK